MKSGATAFVDFRDHVSRQTLHILNRLIKLTPQAETRIRQLTENVGAHAVIVVAGIGAAYNQSLDFLRPLGTLMCVGLPPLEYHLPLSPLQCVNRGYRVVGNAVGTETEMQALLQMAAEGRVSTHYEVFDFAQINQVIDRMERYEIHGRAVLRIP